MHQPLNHFIENRADFGCGPNVSSSESLFYLGFEKREQVLMSTFSYIHMQLLTFMIVV